MLLKKLVLHVRGVSAPEQVVFSFVAKAPAPHLVLQTWPF
jgi:hypothetical protein